MTKKTIMIIGTGVLGSYLSKYFLQNKDKVFVTTRSFKKVNNNYKFQKIDKKVKFIKLDILNTKEISKKINFIKPDIIYYFAGQSSIFLSYKKAKETMNSNFYGALNFYLGSNVTDYNVLLNFSFENASSTGSSVKVFLT